MNLSSTDVGLFGGKELRTCDDCVFYRRWLQILGSQILCLSHHQGQTPLLNSL